MRIACTLKVSVLVSLFILLMNNGAKAQEVGLSFSYFLPKNGYFSTPISPFSLRGIGVDLNRYFALQTGFSLYRMSGLNIKDIGDFESKDALVGPNFTLMVPVELVLQFVGQRQEFRVKGGGFGFLTFDNKLNYGNLDKAIRRFESWEVANSSFDYDNQPGFGYFFGAEYVIFLTRQWGLSLEANYLVGDAGFGLSGSYTGGNTTGGLTTREVAYEDAKLDLTGLELSIGIIITQ
ncbi:MAG: hypothetical protein AAF843_04890 [Bacteroidota bacterium]